MKLVHHLIMKKDEKTKKYKVEVNIESLIRKKN